MKISGKKTGKSKFHTVGRDLKEFERKDLGETLEHFRTAGQWVRPKTRPTSIALSEKTIQDLREKASRKGIGYQTLLKMIVQEHLDEY